MKLLQTNLTTEQAEILLTLKILFSVTKIIDPSIVSVSNDDFQSLVVGGFEFFKDSDETLTLAHRICYGGSYDDLPEYDLVDINTRKEGQSLSSFVIECLQILLKEHCENILCYEQDAAAEYPYWIQRQEDYPILF